MNGTETKKKIYRKSKGYLCFDETIGFLVVKAQAGISKIQFSLAKTYSHFSSINQSVTITKWRSKKKINFEG